MRHTFPRCCSFATNHCWLLGMRDFSKEATGNAMGWWSPLGPVSHAHWGYVIRPAAQTLWKAELLWLQPRCRATYVSWCQVWGTSASSPGGSRGDMAEGFMTLVSAIPESRVQGPRPEGQAAPVCQDWIHHGQVT